jgi:hypothetical protein
MTKVTYAPSRKMLRFLSEMHIESLGLGVT